jgi:nitrogen regulatory protein PII
MKAILISFNQAYYEAIVDLMDRSEINGFTYWDNVAGRGSRTGEPHYGSHAWPTLNGVIWTMIEDDKVERFLKLLHKLDTQAEAQGLRAFVLNVEQSI